MRFLLILMLSFSGLSADQVKHYDYPQSTQDARDSCIEDFGGVPVEGAWFGVSQSTVNYCQSITVWETGKWNWDDRIPVG